MRAILVSHPHAAAISCATAAAMESAGTLAAFVTGVAGVEGTRIGAIVKWLSGGRAELSNRIVNGIPSERLHALPLVELSARAVSRGANAVGISWPRTYDALFVLHDLLVSWSLWPGETDAVYAYEDGALRTFKRAARHGMIRVWDLPLPHWATLERILREESTRWPGAMGGVARTEPDWKKRRKDEELSLADLVSVASDFTRSSLDAIGWQKPVTVTPYGFPVDQFAPKERPPGGPFTVLAVGTQDLRKGTPYLLEAWKQAGIKGAKLRLIGPMKLTSGFLARYEGLFEHLPHLPKVKLADEYRAADLLVFPTLGDGFGLVIQEAMCCATPVVTTPCGGGPECITHGEDGWLVPARDIDALVETMRAAAADRDRLCRVGLAARTRAERWTWIDAGKKLVASLTRALP